MLEITRKNCYKCDLETIIYNNNQYFWINLRDFEAETESKLLNIFNKNDNKSTLKYRRELTPNIKSQADRTFVRNDLFEQVIKSCKATNTEFLIFKEKLGICLYEENYYVEEIIKIQDDIEEPDKKPIEVIDKVSTKKSTKKLNKETNKESNKALNKKSNKEPNKESNKELIETISPKSNENLINWYDKNEFNEILITTDGNKFNHKNKISKFKCNDINGFINNIQNNTISEANAKKKINELNNIKKVETKGKHLIDNQKTLLSLFDDLKTIFNNNNNNKSDNNESNSENESVNENENEYENESVKKDENENENESDDEQYYEIKQLNNTFQKIDETKSFKDQIDIIKEIPWLNDYWYMEYHEDNKETNFRLFKLKFAYIFNDIDDNLFKKIFGLTSVKLADKLINTTSKGENQMLINNIEINRDKIFE